MLDTGSQINTICSKYIPKNLKLEKNDIHVVNYSGGKIDILGTIEADLIIENENWGKSIFYVVPDNLSPILGSEAIKKNEITINLSRNRIIKSGPIQRFASLNLLQNNSPDSFCAYSLETITFRANSETIVDLKVENINTDKNLFFETSNLGNGSRLQLIPSFQILSPSEPVFRLLVINPTDSSVRISAGTVFVKLVEAVEIARISEKYLQNNFEKNIENIKIGAIKSPIIRNKFYNLMKEYSYLFLVEGDTLPPCSIEKFSIITDSVTPIVSHPYRTPFSLRDELRNILDGFLEQGIIEECNSPWNSPCLLVKKKSGAYRLCIDFRKLNASTIQINYPLPNLEDSLSYLDKSRIFSSCDLFKGFHQIEMEPDSIAKTAFSCELGSFAFKRMPMGTRNSPSHFMRMMDKAFFGTPKEEILIYMDDCVCHSQSEKEHFEIVQKFFKILAVNNLRINSKKCNFFEKSLNFCGYFIQNGDVFPSGERVKAILDLKSPKNKEQAQSLFGCLNYHRRFIKDFAQIALPITKSYRNQFFWDENAENALQILKRKISDSALKLKIPPFDKALFCLETDASDKGYGAVLYICEDVDFSEAHKHDSSCLKPVAYNSGNFNETRAKYTIVEKELFSGKVAMEKWSVYLKGRLFHWISDNKNLLYVQTVRTQNNRLARWITEIQGFDFKIFQRPSSQMKISDLLSRNSQIAKISTLTFDNSQLREAQKIDGILSQILKFTAIDRWPNKCEDSDINNYRKIREKLSILETGELVIKDEKELIQFCVPEILQGEIIKVYHEFAHSGQDQTLSRISNYYFWPNMKKSIVEFIKSCDFCQKNKPNTHPNKAPVLTFATPEFPYQAFGFDLVTLRPTDMGNVYVMVVVDLFSKFGYAVPLKSKKAPYLLEKFTNILFRNPKLPQFIIMDNAPEFSDIKNYLKSNSIEVHLSPPLRPQANGQCENFNKQVKSRLRARSQNGNWDMYLQEVVFEINASEHSVTKFSPFAVQTGLVPHSLVDPLSRNSNQKLDVDFSEIKAKIDQEKETRLRKFDNPKFVQYEIGQEVLIKNFRSKYPPFLGPFVITKKSTAGTHYTVKSDTQELRRHANDIRKYNAREIDKNRETNCSSSKEDKNNFLPNSDYQTETENAFENVICGGFERPNQTIEPRDGEIEQSEIILSPCSREKTVEKRVEVEDHDLENRDVVIDSKIPKPIFSSSSESDSEMEFEISSPIKKQLPAVPSSSPEIETNENRIPQSSFSNQSESSLDQDFVNNAENSSPIERKVPAAPASSPELEPQVDSSVESFSDEELPALISSDPIPELDHHLTSFDNLDISANRVDRKRERDSSTNSSPESKILKTEFDDLGLEIRLLSDDREFFEQLKSKFSPLKANQMVDKGCLLKLTDLTKEVLMHILYKFGIDYSVKERLASMRTKIKDHIKSNYLDWQKTPSGEYLFFAMLNLRRRKTLYEMSLQELKVICAHYKLPRVLYYSKIEAIKYIIDQFEFMYPDHPKIDNELIFGPSTSP